MKRKNNILAILISTFFINNAYATEINFCMDAEKISVKCTDTENVDVATIQLLDENKRESLYTGEGELKNGEYIFPPFSFPKDSLSGNYIIRVGENGKITEKKFYYASYNDIYNLVKEANNENPDSDTLIENYSEILGVNKILFDAFPDKWKERMNVEIKKTELDLSTREGVIESQKKLSAVCKKWIGYISLFCESTDEINLSNSIMDIGTLDELYYSKLSNKTDILKYISRKVVDEKNVTEDEISVIFDESVLVMNIYHNDWKTVKDCINYFNEKGIISVDKKYLNANSYFYKELKKEQIEDVQNIEKTFRKVYSDVYDDTTNNKGGGGGSSGGSSVVKKKLESNIPVSIKPEVFKDISDFPWASEAINYLSSIGVLNGKSKDMYCPDEYMTRAETAKTLALALELNLKNSDCDFTDVNKKDWYYTYVAATSEAELIKGYENKSFKPYEYIKREDMACIIYRAAIRCGITTDKINLVFSDDDYISDYAREACYGLKSMKIMSGKENNRFDPEAYVTRAEGAKVIYNLLIKKGE